MENRENKLELIPLYNLLQDNDPMVFKIPSYQRGYRWSRNEVKLLLDDIWEFIERKVNKQVAENEFYCLQPVVVKKNEDENYFELIDGQQRLTTIKLIMKCIFNVLKMPLDTYYRNKHDFILDYATRDLSKQYIDELDILGTENRKKDNIDFYHIWEAYDEINKWMTSKNYDDVNKFRETLLQFNDIENPVKIILYEVYEENTYEIFSRLNIGKIKLTNAELIKALFLKKWDDTELESVFKLKQQQISTDWNLIENTLQQDEIWYFISNVDQKYDNRIEVIFDLLSDKVKGSEQYFTFYHFNNNVFPCNMNSKGIPNIEKIWEDVKKLYLRITDWFSDRELYHYVGYLIATGDTLKKINNYYTEKDDDGNMKIKSKTHFKQFLRGKIKEEKINVTKEDFEELTYPDKKIRTSLLLFNILSHIDSKKSKSKYPFHLHKLQSWDIEHIRSKTDKTINTLPDWKKWVEDIFQFFCGQLLSENTAQEFLEHSITVSDPQIQKNIRDFGCSI